MKSLSSCAILNRTKDFYESLPNSPQGALYLSTSREVCQRLVLPLHPLKCLPPNLFTVVLGIELDTGRLILINNS